MKKESIRKELPDKYQRMIFVVLIVAAIIISVELIFIFKNIYFNNLPNNMPLEGGSVSITEIEPDEYIQVYDSTGSVDEALRAIDGNFNAVVGSEEFFASLKQKIDLFERAGQYQQALDFYETLDLKSFNDEQLSYIYYHISYAYQEMGNNEELMWEFYNMADEITKRLEVNDGNFE